MREHDYVTILKSEGAKGWNQWRKENPGPTPDLKRVNLVGRDLSGIQFIKVSLVSARLDSAILVSANLKGADLTGASLMRARLSLSDMMGVQLQDANLEESDLDSADLTASDLSGASLVGANLEGAILTGAYLKGTNLSGCRLTGADFSRAMFAKTVLGDVDLSQVRGLDSCEHLNRSTLGIDSFYRSRGKISSVFLRGIGCPEYLIQNEPNSPVSVSCFISYSTNDEKCVRQIYADLQANGVRCWFARESLGIGSKIWDGIDSAIQDNDRLLVVLSQSAISSPWVEDEVNKAFAEERKRRQTVLLPIRLDDAVMVTSAPWATKIRETRNIGDFTRWEEGESYSRALSKLLKDIGAAKGTMEMKAD